MTYTVEIPEDGGNHPKAFRHVLKALEFPFKKAKKEKPYNPEFVAKVEEALAQVKRGEVYKIALEDLWK